MKTKTILKSLFVLGALFLSGSNINNTHFAKASSEDLSTLVNKYYNSGIYTKKSNIYVNESVKEEVAQYFHGSVALDRTTYYNGNQLLMGDFDGGFTTINSGYGTDENGNLTHFRIDENKQKVNEKFAANKEHKNWDDISKDGMEGFYVTLNDMLGEDYFASWTNGEYHVTENNDLVYDFLAFTAPCLTDVALTTNYFTITKLTISEESLRNVEDYLSLKIYVASGDSGKLSNNDLILSEARIYLDNRAFDEETLKPTYNVWDGTVASSIENGTGTETDPYLISTSSELAFVAQKANEGDSNYLSAYYKQISHLDLNKINWTPISTTSPFKGFFDGNGKSIIGLSVNQEGQNAGLFALTNNATIKNIDVTGNVVGGNQCNAILVARGAATTLSNCISRGSVTGTGLYSSGIMSIVNPVTGTKTIIDNCVNYANIKCDNSGAAGISAYLNSAVTEIKNCKNYGNISYASHYVGGIVGRALKAEGSFIENCYNYGDISQHDTTTSVTTVAGVIGDTAIKVKNCYNYYKSTINGYSINAGTALLYPTTAGGNTSKKGAICGLLRAASSCSSDAGFVDCGICDKDGNVVFSGDVNLWNASVATSIASGTGTETDPYLISSGAELAFVAQQVKANDTSYKTAYYKLTSNINLNNAAWSGIGYSNTVAFQGHFDGNGKAIIGLKQSTAGATGLFTHIADAYIDNLTVIGNVSSSGANNGLLVGRAQPSTITNCTTLGTVTNTSQYAGAITATINAYASGVTGTQTKMIIENCTNYADITGVKRIGALTSSQNKAVPTDFINCVNYGTITGTGTEIGGLVGILNSTGTMKDCVNYGQFNAPTAATNNPLVGNNGGTITNCYDYQ